MLKFELILVVVFSGKYCNDLIFVLNLFVKWSEIQLDEKEKILDDFEHRDQSRYLTNHQFVSSYDLSLSKEQAKFGQFSLKLFYHFGGWKSGNGAMYIRFKEDFITERMPEKLGLWVYGDGHSPWLRATLLDGHGERKWVNLTSGNINWRGWKYIDTPIDPNWVLPLRLEQIYAVEQNKELQGNRDYTGCFYLDHLRFVYEDLEDLSGPEFRNIQPVTPVIYRNHFIFSTKVVDMQTGVDPHSIKVKVNNKQVDFTYDSENQEITYSFQRLKAGYYHVYAEARDHAGNLSIPCVNQTYRIDLSPDLDPPLLSQITPVETVVERTQTPRITFHLSDQKSGVDPGTIEVLLNEEGLEVYFDADTGWGYALPIRKLENGTHILEITAKDYAGNQIAQLRKFQIQALPEPIGKQEILIIPDTHSFDCGMRAFQLSARRKPDFIIQMGDMVDQALQAEYEKLPIIFSNMGRKIPIFMTPGNHEAFQGDLNLYRGMFGSPTYHFVNGETMFVFLNSAIDQSITASDSTQFHYLQRILAEQQNKNVVIITHVPTRDDFGTAHQMEQKDARELERILKCYKEKHPSVAIKVLFGHLHVLRQWELAGIDYIITGNSAAKGYVGPEKGNILGQGLLIIHQDATMEYQFIPYRQSIYLIHERVKNGRLHLRVGEKVRPQLMLSPEGTGTDLGKYSAIPKKWISDHGEIAEVDLYGQIEARSVGITNIRVQIMDQQVILHLEVSHN